MVKEYEVGLEIASEFACFTRADTGITQVSEMIPSLSAFRSIFEKILWLKNVRIVPKRLEICNPVNFQQIGFNLRGPCRKSILIKEGNSFQLFRTVLTNVRYRLYAIPVIIKPFRLPNGRHLNSAHYYQSRFNKRLERQQFFQVPYLGLRSFTASYVGPVPEEKSPPADINATIPQVGGDPWYNVPPMISVTIRDGVVDYKKAYSND